MTNEETPSKKSDQRKGRRRALLLVGEIFVLLSTAMFLAGAYKLINFPKSHLSEMVFYWNHGILSIVDGATLAYVVQVLLASLGVWLVMRLPMANFKGVRFRFTTRRKTETKDRILRPPTWGTKSRTIYSITLLLLAASFAAWAFKVPQYLLATDRTQIYEQNFVDPATVKIDKPEKYRNLVFIYLESMENTLLSNEHGGQVNRSLSEPLEKLALNPASISFSNRTDTLGGANEVPGTGWSVAGMVATSGGIPLSPSVGNWGSTLEEFLPGAYMLGDLLADHGYEQSMVLGTDPGFGGIDKLMTRHGRFNMLIPSTLKAAGRLPKDYHKWWGFEDRKMFSFAKEEATRLAGTGRPFHLQLFSEDTHFPHGYNDPECKTNLPDLYDDAYACTSGQVMDFVNWLQQQPYAENTTIVLVGDHLGHLTSYYEKKIHDKDYKRTTYNVILNSVKTPPQTKGRTFTSLDFYPTIVSALGFKIQGNKLGLGTDLFSGDATLAEQIGLEKMEEEFNKRSNFYDASLLGGK